MSSAERERASLPPELQKTSWRQGLKTPGWRFRPYPSSALPRRGMAKVLDPHVALGSTWSTRIVPRGVDEISMCSNPRLSDEDDVATRCFVGWYVLLGCFFLQLASSPGHTFGINAFIEHWIADLQISRAEVSVVWLVASCCSAALTPVAGALLDKHGARRATLVVGPLLVADLLWLSRTQTWAALCAGIAGTRFLGAESCMLIANTTACRWFIRLRGRATALLGLSGVVLMSLPPMLTLLVERVGWRGSYVVLAVTIATLLSMASLLVRDSPTSVGLLPDGDRVTHGVLTRRQSSSLRSERRP